MAVYVNKSLQMKTRKDLSILPENVVESIFIEVMIYIRRLIVGVVCCPKCINN